MFFYFESDRPYAVLLTDEKPIRANSSSVRTSQCPNDALLEKDEAAILHRRPRSDLKPVFEGLEIKISFLCCSPQKSITADIKERQRILLLIQLHFLLISTGLVAYPQSFTSPGSQVSKEVNSQQQKKEACGSDCLLT